MAPPVDQGRSALELVTQAASVVAAAVAAVYSWRAVAQARAAQAERRLEQRLRSLERVAELTAEVRIAADHVLAGQPTHLLDAAQTKLGAALIAWDPQIPSAAAMVEVPDPHEVVRLFAQALTEVADALQEARHQFESA